MTTLLAFALLFQSGDLQTQLMDGDYFFAATSLRQDAQDLRSPN